MLEQYVTAQVQTGGEIVVPKGYEGDKKIIIPDEIVHYCINRYELTKADRIGLDPLCGVGTIPRVINGRGGNCLGIELDPDRYAFAARAIDAQHIRLGDFRKFNFDQKPFDYLFTSMPFVWFQHKATDQVLSRNGYAEAMRKLLSPQGFLLLDSMEYVQREEEGTWFVAQPQIEYLKKHGFTLTEAIVFENLKHQDGNSESLILKFTLPA